VTREEKLDWLCRLRSDLDVWIPEMNKYKRMYKEVLTEEIQALEQEPTTKNNLSVDCIDRAQAQTEIELNASRYTLAEERGSMGKIEWSGSLIKVGEAVDIIRSLPSVKPTRKKGHWEQYGDFWKEKYRCSECKEEQPKILCGEQIIGYWSDFCPNCGAEMQEVER
jgi:hypothetical protein